MGDFIINNKTVASLMISNKEVIRIADGQTILWEKTTPQVIPTLVDYVHALGETSTGNYISTGIYPTTGTVFRIVYKPNRLIASAVVGFTPPEGNTDTPQTSSNDDDDYRFFYHSGMNDVTLDFNSSREYSLITFDDDGYADITCGNNYITDNLDGSTDAGNTQSIVETNNVPIYLNVSSDLDFQSLEIWQNNVKVYDGHAAVLNGTYGVYDSVTSSFTSQTYGGNSMSGGSPIVLRFIAEEANTTVGMEHFGTNQTTTQPVIYYSTDKTNWNLWDYSTITLANVGDKVYFYGDNPNGIGKGDSHLDGYSIFRVSKSVGCFGNIMSLLSINCGYVIPNKRCFEMLFFRAPITSPPELPATALTEHCYDSMFQNCTSLESVPELPATTVPSHAYNSMFYQCTSLITSPELPATTLGTQCYSRMFEKCTNLTTGPSVLPATTLANACYENMFYDCTSLTNAPVLPATTLAQSCYVFMFDGCTSLNNITCLATDISAYHCTMEWLENVASTGTFTKKPQMSGWTIGISGIPSGWTVVDYAVPTPTISFTNGEYQDECQKFNGSGTTTIACSNNLASIYYRYVTETCVSNTPTFDDITQETWTLYSGPITFTNYKSCGTTNGKYKIQAKASFSGISDSQIVESAVTIQPDQGPCNCQDDYVTMGYWSEGHCECERDGDYMGHASIGDCMCNEYNECIDCSTDWETLGYGSEEECNCGVYDNCVDCSDCTNYWEDCGYSTYEDCRCDQYGECDEPEDPCQECLDECAGDPDCEAECYEEPGPCYDACDDWEGNGYESYEDCRCDMYGENCPEVGCSDCSNWEECGYSNYEDCDCIENENCP